MRSKNPQARSLDVIANEIRARAETIGDIIAIGGLLLEAKDQLRHGQWLPWLQQEFGYSARTAQNYMRAHKFAGKYENVADLKLTSTALYRLTDTNHRRRGHSSIYTPEAIAAILAEAKEKPVGSARADEIAVALRHQCEGDGAPAAGHKPDSDPAPIPPTPALQPAPLPRDACLRDKFAAAIAELETLTTKPSAKFVGVIPADRLEMIGNFLNQIAAASRRTA